MKSIAIFDIDGTLGLPCPRYYTFAEAMNVPVNETTASELRECLLNGKHVSFNTFRSDADYYLTSRWLREKAIGLDISFNPELIVGLFMTPSMHHHTTMNYFNIPLHRMQDYWNMSQVVVPIVEALDAKLIYLERLNALGFEVAIAYEDDLHICEAYSRRGIKTMVPMSVNYPGDQLMEFNKINGTDLIHNVATIKQPHNVAWLKGVR